MCNSAETSPAKDIQPLRNGFHPPSRQRGGLQGHFPDDSGENAARTHRVPLQRPCWFPLPGTERCSGCPPLFAALQPAEPAGPAGPAERFRLRWKRRAGLQHNFEGTALLIIDYRLSAEADYIRVRDAFIVIDLRGLFIKNYPSVFLQTWIEHEL